MQLCGYLQAQYPQDFHFLAHDSEHAVEAREAAAAFAARNIFVPDSLLGFYDQFVAADRDHNGMVSEEEMAVRIGCCLLRKNLTLQAGTCRDCNGVTA